MDQECRHQSQEHGQSTPRNSVDQCGQENQPKSLIAEDLPEVIQGKVELEKGNPSKIPKGDRLEAEPQVPDHRKDHEGQDDCECGEQHPEGKPGLLIQEGRLSSFQLTIRPSIFNRQSTIPGTSPAPPSSGLPGSHSVRRQEIA